jgi:hypothetical protein
MNTMLKQNRTKREKEKVLTFPEICRNGAAWGREGG